MATQAITLIIGADGKTAVAEVKRVEGEVSKLGPAAQRAQKDFSGVESAALKMGAALASVFSVGVAGRALVQTAVETGRLRASLETVTGSIEGAAIAWRELERFAATTPYALDQTVTAFTRLKALGLDPSMEALRSYGNTASAMGKDLMQMIEAVADATTGEFERLKEFGIRASKTGDQVAFTFRGVTTAVQRDAAAIEQYLRAIGNTEFVGAMERQMNTLGGAISNLGDASQRFWRALADTGASELLSDLTRAAIGWLDKLSERLEGGRGRLSDFVDGLERAWSVYVRETRAGGWLEQAVAALRSATMVDQIGGVISAVFDTVADYGATSAKSMQEAANRTDDFTAALRRLADNLARVDEKISAGDQSLEIWMDREAIMGQMRTYAQLLEQEQGFYEKNAESANKAAQSTSKYADALAQALGVAGKTESVSAILPIIDTMAAKWDVARELIISVIDQESAWDRWAKSSAGAIGLMQLMPGTARDMGYSVQQVTQDMTANVEAGVKYLKKLLTMYQGDVEKTLRAYNAGPVKVEASKRFSETNQYVAAVIANLKTVIPLGEKAGEAWERLIGPMDKAAQKAMDAAEQFQAVGATEPSLDGLAEAVENIAEKYLPAERNTRRFAEAQAILNVAVTTGITTQERATAILSAMTKEMQSAGEKITTVAELWSESLKEMGRNIQGVFADAIREAKFSMDTLKDVVLDSLAELAAALLMRPVNILINGVLGTAAAGAAGTAAASTGGGGFGLGGIGSFLGGTGIGSSLAGGLGWIQGLFGQSAGTSGLLNTAAANLQISPNWAFGLGGIGGGLLGSMLFSGGQSGVGSSIGSAIGTAIGSAILPGIGTVLGGLLGGAGGGFLGSLFGGGEQKAPTAWIDIQQGRFVGTGQQGLTDQQVEGILAAVDTVNQALTSAAEILGPAAQANLALQSRPEGAQALAPGQIDSWLQNEAQKLVGYMAKAVPGELGDAIEEAFASSGGNLQAFLAQVQELQATFEALPEVVAALSAAGLNLGANAETAAFQLIRAAGGLDALQQAQSSLAQVMFSESERQAMAQEQLASALKEVGLTVPSTRDGLREMVQGLDLSAEAGREAYLTLAAFAGVLGEVISANEAAANAAREAARQTTASLEALIYTEQELAALAAQRAAAEANAIGVAALGIDITKLTQAQFAAAIQALGGVGAAMAALGDQAQDFVKAVSAYYAAQTKTTGATQLYTSMVVAHTRATSEASRATNSLTESLLDWVRRTRGEIEEAAGSRSLDIAQTQFASQLGLAQRGDSAALGSITEYADRYLEAAKRSARTRGAYEEVVGYVTARVESLTRRDRGRGDPQVDEIARLREETKAANIQMLSVTNKLARYLSTLERWEAIGLPAERS